MDWAHDGLYTVLFLFRTKSGVTRASEHQTLDLAVGFPPLSLIDSGFWMFFHVRSFVKIAEGGWS